MSLRSKLPLASLIRWALPWVDAASAATITSGIGNIDAPPCCALLDINYNDFARALNVENRRIDSSRKRVSAAGRFVVFNVPGFLCVGVLAMPAIHPP